MSWNEKRIKLAWHLVPQNTTKGVEWCYEWRKKPRSFLNVISILHSLRTWSRMLLVLHLLVNDYKLKVRNWTWKSCQKREWACTWRLIENEEETNLHHFKHIQGFNFVQMLVSQACKPRLRVVGPSTWTKIWPTISW